MPPKQSSSKKTEQPVAEQPKTEKKQTKKQEKKEEQPVVEQPKTDKKVASKKTDKKVEQAPVEQPKTETVQEQTEKKRRVVSNESVHNDFSTLLEKVMAEIDRLRQQKQKTKGVKFLKTLKKDISQLHNDCNRVTKFKKNKDRKGSTTSGFLKPVNISQELAKFTGWDVKKTYSRTQVTKFICNYIKTKVLFDTSPDGDKRNILVDAALKTLLKYDPQNPPRDEDGNALPLTYFRLQQYLKHHFKPVTAPQVEVEDDLE